MADDPDFAKGASGPGSVYDTSASGLGLSPAYLANTRSSAEAVGGGGGTGTGGNMSGPSASRPPPADLVNLFYYATDTGVLWFSDGLTWHQVPAAAVFETEIDAGEKFWTVDGLPPDSQPEITIVTAFNHVFSTPPRVVVEDYRSGTGVSGADTRNITTSQFEVVFNVATGSADPSSVSGSFNWIAVRV